ncbi:MAG: MerR family transcriptional regulator [marine bacterium B5-7]|nr:MAG: MerR family transcriptional regulator [marine bacterium B5-7]
MSIKPTTELPPLPEEKRYFTIGEVSELCEVKSHVLRYWESEFPPLRPSKRRGRRYYTRDDVEMVRRIRTLLYEKGFTIPGARGKLLDKTDDTQEVNAYRQVLKETLHCLDDIAADLS